LTCFLILLACLCEVSAATKEIDCGPKLCDDKEVVVDGGKVLTCNMCIKASFRGGGQVLCSAQANSCMQATTDASEWHIVCSGQINSCMGATFNCEDGVQCTVECSGATNNCMGATFNGDWKRTDAVTNADVEVLLSCPKLRDFSEDEITLCNEVLNGCVMKSFTGGGFVECGGKTNSCAHVQTDASEWFFVCSGELNSCAHGSFKCADGKTCTAICSGSACGSAKFTGKWQKCSSIGPKTALAADACLKTTVLHIFTAAAVLLMSGWL